MPSKVVNFTMHDALGHAVLREDWLLWVRDHNGPGEFGAVTHYSWEVDGREIIAPIDISKVIWHLLPDESGFICFEDDRDTDNSYILDAYGNERYRLRVPWELTPYDVPAGAKMWFRNVGTHMDGQFGVTAWIECAGDFYFELDYNEGHFLWAREIRF